MGSEEELDQELKKREEQPEGSTSALQLNVLKSAPEGMVKLPAEQPKVGPRKLSRKSHLISASCRLRTKLWTRSARPS